MIITVWRHGEAEQTIPDEQRELTSSGMDDIGFGCHQFVSHLKARNLPAPEAVFSSTLLRARQTADIIAGVFTQARVSDASALVPGASVEHVDALVTQWADTAAPDAHLLLVSHQPLVSLLLDYWTGEPGKVALLPPGGLATVELGMAGPGQASLQFWCLPPEYGVGM
ncbi:MAG: histidine phosphatase family protein [Halioglobus sp.]